MATNIMQPTQYSILSSIILSFCLLFLSACSNTNDAATNKNKKQAVKSAPSKTTTKNLTHVHTTNPCSAALAHAHSYSNEQHQHSYNCENTNTFISNAHVHEATKTSKKFRHVHPNGANKHSHH